MMLSSLGTVPTGIFCSCLAAIAITVLQATRFVLELARTQGFTAGPFVLLLGVRNFIYFTEAFI